MQQFIVNPSKTLSGALRVASDKSISHRAVLLASLAEGETEIVNPLVSEDVRATIQVMRAGGVHIDDDTADVLKIRGDGGLKIPPGTVINCGNAGTLMRLFCGIAVANNVDCQLIGDESLMRRPMRRVTMPLNEMGAVIEGSAKGRPPIVISARNDDLRGILHNNHQSSAQVKSALLLAGMHAHGTTVIAEPILSRDHTERMLEVFGAHLRCSADGCIVEIQGGQSLRSPGRIEVPADLSSAMFFIVAAAISPGSEIVLSEVIINPSRAGGMELLMRMGADIDVENRRTLGSEPVADIRVRGGQLHGIAIEPGMVPSAIDDFPALFIAAAAARGQTTLSGAQELRHKESDRLATMATGLKTLGVECQENDDGIAITGRHDSKYVFGGGDIDASGDHRIAMAFTMAAMRAKNDITIDECDNVQTSFPNFIKQANSIGIRVIEQASD